MLPQNIKSRWQKVSALSLCVVTLLFLGPTVAFSQKFNIGDRVYVTSGPLNVRATPSLSGTSLGTQATNAQGTVTGGPTSADGYVWWNINYDINPDGWSVENYLAKAASSPTLSSVSPNPATGSNSAQTLTLTGSGFVSGCTVTLRGVSFSGTYSNIATTFTSSTQVSISVTLGTDPSTWSAQVINPNGAQSAQVNFTVNAPFPVITSLSPNSKTAGEPAFTLTVNGSTFTSSSTVRWNGSNRTTTPTVSGGGLVTALQASILASDIASAGTAQVTVFNPSPGGGTSSGATFTIPPTGFSLAFPLQGKTPLTAAINSVFDHSMTSSYTADNTVVAYTGEKGERQFGARFVTTFNGVDLYGFKNSAGSNFVVNGNYTGGGTSSSGDYAYLYYDGHPGFDYRTIDQGTNVPVLAAAPGTAYQGEATFGTVYIDHGNNYRSYYLHLVNSSRIASGTVVSTGQQIGIAGNTGAGAVHLHFEVRKNVNGQWIPVDPYGWQGSGTDPYIALTGVNNVNLWQGQSNNPPNIPTAINQFKSDGTTTIPEGGTTTESTVIFKGTVSDPDGDQVRLEMELRQTNESFTGTPTPETISSFVASGSQVPPITRGGLVNGSYKWQYRAVDSKGAVSSWREFETAGNIDFVVNVQTGTVTVNATLNGSPWSGNISYRITGPQTIDGSSVPQTYANRPTGSYTISYLSGGPTGATFKDITMSATQTLTASGTITFTMNFTSGGVNPTPQEISDLADQLSNTYKVPSVVIKALMEQESGWQQFKADGSHLINTEPDGRIGIGLSQVTVQPSPSTQTLSLGRIEPGIQGSNNFTTSVENVSVDINRLKDDWRYNTEIGVRVLVAKKVESAGAPDDARILENWYYPLAYYNGAVKGGANDPANSRYSRQVSTNNQWKDKDVFPFQECVYNITAQLYAIPIERRSYFGPPIKATLPGPAAVATGAGRYNYVEPIFCFFDWAIYSSVKSCL